MAGLLNCEVRERPQELLRRVAAGGMYRAAREEQVSLSYLMDTLDPSDQHAGDDAKLDAFGRALKAAGIRTGSDYTRGYWASTWEEFQLHPEARVLIPEFAARRWRESRSGQPANPNAMQMSDPENDGQNRAVFTSADELLGSAARPYFDMSGVRQTQLTPDIRVTDVVARSEGISGNAYRATYMDDPTEDEMQMTRVNEAAQIPVTMIRSREEENTLHKYGRGFVVTDEAARRSRVDKIGFFLARAALQDEDHRVANALDTAINGDGNGNAATVFMSNALNSAAVDNVLDLKTWMTFRHKFRRGYAMTAVFAREAETMQLVMLNTGSTALPLSTLPNAGQYTIVPINNVLSGGIRYGVHDQPAAMTYLGMDTRFAVERVFEIGANTNESERFAGNQTTAFYVTEVEGYGVIDENASKILNINF